jgi:hypothetical protein
MKHRLRMLPEVREALAAGRPVVALESTIITHGMPAPRNLETARTLSSSIFAWLSASAAATLRGASSGVAASARRSKAAMPKRAGLNDCPLSLYPLVRRHSTIPRSRRGAATRAISHLTES